MANLQKQIDALTAYFQADCARPGVLPIALTIEHFITRELADLMRYAGADEALNLDGGGSSTLYTSMLDRKSTRLNSSHRLESRMPSSA